MITLTRAQREALHRVYMRMVRSNQPDDLPTYRAFRRTVQPGPNCVMVRHAGMWLGIETDGDTHS